ncbi:MAG: YkgJ family cysteine cluster protein [Dehalococcoidales bacterium]|nr:YkgJ family cysteine cluster protein [Dehalococcoidales bacterium]
MNKPFEELLKRLSALESIHGLFDTAEKEVVEHIGLPICMENCGKCCENNVVMAWGIEVEDIATYLISDDKLLNKVMDRCEAWMKESTGPVFTVKQLLRDQTRLMKRAREIFTGRCPLMEGTRCLIHPVRPVACRSFGVTTYPRGCKRPPGFGETIDRRAYNQGMAIPIMEAVNAFLVDCSDKPYDTSVGFLPMMLMSRLRAREFAGLVDSGKVDPVKLVKNQVHSLAALVESQFNTFEMAGDKALQKVEEKAIKTGPLTFVIK